MTDKNFTVDAVWDAEAKVWYSESNIIGLHIEAETFEEFEKEVREHAAYLVVANHYPDDVDRTDLKNLIPAIFFRAANQGPSTA